MKPKFITLTNGDITLWVLESKILAIANKLNEPKTEVWIESTARPFYADQSPAQILAMIQEAE